MELTCREVTEFLDGYVEGGLHPLLLAAFETHLPLCRDCRNYLDQYRVTLQLLRADGRAAAERPPPTLPADLIQAILAARATEARPHSGPSV